MVLKERYTVATLPGVFFFHYWGQSVLIGIGTECDLFTDGMCIEWLKIYSPARLNHSLCCSLLHIKFTASVKKSLHEICDTCFLHSLIYVSLKIVSCA